MSRPSALGRVAGPMNLFPFIPALRRFADEFIGRIAVYWDCLPPSVTLFFVVRSYEVCLHPTVARRCVVPPPAQ
jgi:hypothetical protein